MELAIDVFLRAICAVSRLSQFHSIPSQRLVFETTQLSFYSPIMSSLSFEQAAEAVKALKSKPDNDTLLKLYGLYKQATAGDVTGSQPWAVQVEARAKWDAWNANKGKSADAAKAEYVTLVQSLLAADK